MLLLNSLRTMVRRAPAPHQGSRRPSGHHPRKRRLDLEPREDRSLPSCTVSLAPAEAAPQLVGERVTLTATATDFGAAPVYQFSAAPHGGAFHVVRDFS